MRDAGREFLEADIRHGEQHVEAVVPLSVVLGQRIETCRHVGHPDLFEFHRVDAAGDDQVVAHDHGVAVLLGGPAADPPAPRVVEAEVLGDDAVVGRQVVLGEQVGDHRGLAVSDSCDCSGVPVDAAEHREVPALVPRHVIVRVPVLGHPHVTLHLGLAHG